MEDLDRRSALKLGAFAAAAAAFPMLAACAKQEDPAPTPDPSPEPAPEPPVEPEPPSTEPDPIHYTIDNIRQYVYGVEEEVELTPEEGQEHGRMVVPIGFDNAATTPAFIPVLNEVSRSLQMYGAVHRGYSQKATITDSTYEEVREKVLRFVGVDPNDYVYTAFFAQNTTDGINKLADAIIGPDDVVLTTRLEHHANLLTWRTRCKTIIAEPKPDGRMDYDEIERLLTENPGVKLVAVTAASNVTGYVTDVHRVAKMAHAHGAQIFVDGAQIVAHRKFSMLGDTPEEDIDYFAFSAHKMYAPFGGGAVVARLDDLNAHMPRNVGGGIVLVVGDDWVNYKSAPAIYEAGSPNFPGVVALGAAIDVLQEVGFDAIEAHEQALLRRLIDGMKKVEGLRIFGDTEKIDDKTGVVSFKVAGLNTAAMARDMSGKFGVACRRGAFCAHPYVWWLYGLDDEEVRGFSDCDSINTAGMIRLSFGIYNTEEEVDRFLELLPDAIAAGLEAQQWYTYANPDY